MRTKALRCKCWDVSEEKLEASWAGAKCVRRKRVGNEVREVRHWKDSGFALSELETLTGF